MIKFFQNKALFWVKNANFVAKLFGDNIQKIITSVPGHPVIKKMFKDEPEESRFQEYLVVQNFCWSWFHESESAEIFG
jgi:hypothetical protein